MVYEKLKSIIALDTEKAIDRVEWGYHFQSLERFKFGPKFISWLKNKSPMSSVSTNNMDYQYFLLQRGTMQGRPIAPFLFAIAIEPLAASQRSSPEIRSILRSGKEHFLSH